MTLEFSIALSARAAGPIPRRARDSFPMQKTQRRCIGRHRTGGRLLHRYL
jgi:hypothetical protein